MAKSKDSLNGLEPALKARLEKIIDDCAKSYAKDIDEAIERQLSNSITTTDQQIEDACFKPE